MLTLNKEKSNMRQQQMVKDYISRVMATVQDAWVNREVFQMRKVEQRLLYQINSLDQWCKNKISTLNSEFAASLKKKNEKIEFLENRVYELKKIVNVKKEHREV